MKIVRHFFSIIIILLIIFSVNHTLAQSPEGTIRYIKTSNWTKMMEKVDYISKQQRDRNKYVWGTRSEWKQFKLLHFNATSSKYEDSEEQAEPDMEGWSNRKETFFMKRDYLSNTLFYAISLQSKPYQILDSIHPVPWKILNNMKEVAGHICMNASITDTLRQQSIEAWFALDMPGKAGPDRFYGLPGMILEVNINNGALIFSADRIDLKPLTSELDIPKKLKGKKINLAEYERIFAKQIQEKKADEIPWFWGLPY